MIKPLTTKKLITSKLSKVLLFLITPKINKQNMTSIKIVAAVRDIEQVDYVLPSLSKNY